MPHVAGREPVQDLRDFFSVPLLHSDAPSPRTLLGPGLDDRTASGCDRQPMPDDEGRKVPISLLCVISSPLEEVLVDEGDRVGIGLCKAFAEHLIAFRIRLLEERSGNPHHLRAKDDRFTALVGRGRTFLDETLLPEAVDSG